MNTAKGTHGFVTVHGYGSTSIRHPLYTAWMNMKQRVLNPNNPYYPRYGGRGIDMDPRWEDFTTFAADVGEKPAEEEGRLTIDRIDNDRGYWPDNIRWATYSENTLNRGSHKYSREEAR